MNIDLILSFSMLFAGMIALICSVYVYLSSVKIQLENKSQSAEELVEEAQEE